MEKIRVFESFSGYGSQTIALAALGVPYEVVGTSDIEPNAIIAYAAMRNRLHKNEATKEEMLALLESRNIGWDFQKNKSTLRSMKADKLQMLYDAVVNCNNLGDISLINPNDMPNADMFTYSSPCQSFSLAGKNEGGEWICEDCEEKFNPIMNSFLEICPKCGSFQIKKPTSSLLWECVKIINAKHYPILMMENVKNIVGEKNKPVFDKWCEYLESQGYENHWTILNAKELNVPQNRERMIMISVHKASHWHSDLNFHNFKFPKKMELEYCIRDAMQPEEEVADKFYLTEEIINRFQEQYVGDNVVGTTKTRPDAIGQRALVYNPEKIIGTLTATDYKQAKSVLLHIGDCEYEVLNVKDKDSLEKILASTPCVVAQRGRLNTEGKYDQCYEPNTTGTTNTLTTALKDNYILNESDKSQDIIYVGSLKLLGMLPYCKMHDQCGRIYGTNGIAPTITTMTGGHQEPKIMCCVYSDDEQKLIIRYFTIRKLTPIECGRLMGVPNPFIQRCVDVGLKDSHLYHMFGNSIVTTMLMGVFGELFNVDSYDQKICNLTASIYKKKV